MSYPNVIEEINSHSYDIAMSPSPSMNQIKSAYFYRTLHVPATLLCCPAKNEKTICNGGSDNINHKKIQIAVLKGSSYESVAKELFPHIKLLSSQRLLRILAPLLTMQPFFGKSKKPSPGRCATAITASSSPNPPWAGIP